MHRFALTFSVLPVVLFTVELLDAVQTAMVQPLKDWLADISAAIITPLDEHVSATGRILRHPETGFAVSIEAG